MSDLDIFTVDRDIRRAAAEERVWWRRLRADAAAAAAEPWFEAARHVTTRTMFESVSALPAGDSFREPLRRWVYRLALARIAQPALARAEWARQERNIELNVPTAGSYSARDLVYRILAEREPVRRRLWVEGLAASAGPVASAARHAREAELEIGARLGAGDGSTLFPYDAAALHDAAGDLLAKTDSMARSFFAPENDWAGLAGKMVAREVPGVWPGGSLLRWTVEPFRTTPLLEGVTLDLGPVPATLGVSSFLRALARFGAAYGRAACATGSTFVHAHDPSELGSLRRGSLFAGLLTLPPFLRHRVGLSPESARGAAREVGLVLLLGIRLDALRTLVDLLQVPESEGQDRLQDVFKVSLPSSLVGVMPRALRRAPHALAGALLAVSDAEMLRERFDEDWYRSPHALRHLRESDAAPYAVHLPKDIFAGAAARLATWFESIVG